MGNSSRSTKILIALLGTAVVALTAALVLVTRSPQAPGPSHATAPGPERIRQQGGFTPIAPERGHAVTPPARARNELGQPLNEDGRPIGPPEKLARMRQKPIAPGDLPITPPRFTDAVERAAFKRWWVDEFGRRISIYQTLEPDRAYPGAEDAAHMLDELYDAAEPRAPGESVEDAYARRQKWHALWKQFLDTYGAPIQTVVSRGGDPQYGEPAAPPVQPPGAGDSADTPVPAAQPATDFPPGRGPADNPDSASQPPHEPGAERATGK